MAPTKAERAARVFWNQSDIQICCGLPYKVAKKVFAKAKLIDVNRSDGWVPFENRVLKSTVKEILGIKKNADLV